MAHGGVHDDANRLAFSRLGDGFAQPAANRIQIVALLDVHNLPAKCGEFASDIAHGHDFVGGAVNLLAVGINGTDEVVDVFGASVKGGFPNLAFLQFAVAVQGEDEAVVTGQFFSLGGANRHAEALAQGARGDAHTGEAFVRCGVALEARVELSERIQLVHRKVATARQNRVKHGADVAIGQEEEVFALAVHVKRGGSVAENVKVEGDKEFRTAHGASGVT